MTESTTFIHQAQGQFTFHEDGQSNAEFIIEGRRKTFSGRFVGEIPPPFHAPWVTLHFEHLDNLFGKFDIEASRHPIVGPKQIHLPFVRPGLNHILIEGQLAHILPKGIVVKGAGVWLIG